MKDLDKAIKHIKKADPILGKVIIQLGELEMRKRPRGRFEALVKAIVSQQLSTKAAATIFERFRKLYPGSFPKPEDILKTRDAKLRSAGLSYQKISYIKDLADHVLTKKLHLQKLSKMSDQEIIDELVAVKGIGQWTAEMFLMFSLERPDVFSVGDLGLRNAMIKIYNLPKGISYNQLLEIAKKWSPYRTIASRYLWQSLDNDS
ncbi:MAG: DNA-3-methyladenine glycosylase [Candidatus Doudnabacteria bacterium]